MTTLTKFLIACLIAFALGLFIGGHALASGHDVRVGLLLASTHHVDPSDDREDFNEDNLGVYVMYDGWIGGTFKNSHDEQALLAGYEYSFTRWRHAELSTTWALANGYQDDPHFAGEWQALVTFNVRIGPVKTYHSPIVSAIGVEHQVAGHE
ncbi:MAG: hypothetical protein ACR2PR_08140 [Pseudohongiellaceae bacterium]